MLAAGTTLGPYKILAPLGAGGMGEVYRARDTRLGRDVAIKVIHAEVAREPDRIKRFEQEARAAGALSHPNVCAIYDIGAYEGSPYVVMELLEGESLREKLRAGPLPVRKAIDYAAQAAHGLAAAHEKGIIHRDLKPENLFVTKDGRVKVLDFGLAKLTRPDMVAAAGEPTVSIAATETGAILGTVGYMSPEQVRGQEADGRSDLFALGAILHEQVTGLRAFHGATYVETLNAILNEEPAPLSASGRDIPSGLEPIVRRCLEKSPAERFQSASDLAFALGNLSGSGSGPVLAAMPAAKRGAGLRRLGVIGALAACIGLAVLSALLIQKVSRSTDPSRVKFTQLTFQRGFQFRARFTADGSRVIYDASRDGGPWRIYETQPGAMVSRDLGIPPAFVLAVSSSGMLAIREHAWGLWTYGEGVSEVPISGGTPRKVSEDAHCADWHPDGRTVALVRAQGGKQRVEMPPGHVVYETAGILIRVRVSPDGKHVAVTEMPDVMYSNVRVVVADTAGKVAANGKVTMTLGDLAWSPDGREVWYSGGEDVSTTELRGLSLSGRDRLIARFPGGMSLLDVGRDGRILMNRGWWSGGIRGQMSPQSAQRELGWYDQSALADISPDGNTLLFTDMSPSGGLYYSVCIRGMDGSLPTRLGQGRAQGLSPDGRWALAIQQREPPQLVLLPIGAGDSLVLPRRGIDKYLMACWMPDGKHVLFNGAEGGRPVRTFVQEIPAGAPRPLTPEGSRLLPTPRIVSPDGREIVYFSRGYIRVKPVEADSGRVVAQRLPGDWPIGWASDGRSFYFAQADSNIRIDKLDMQSGRRARWKTIDLGDRAGLATTETIVAITPDGRAWAFDYGRGNADLFLVEGLK